MTDRRKQYTELHRYKSELSSDVSMLTEKEQDKMRLALNKEWTNPKYKIRQFVGQAQITPYAKYRQWLLELKGKEESIENIEYEIAKYEVEIKRFHRMADDAYDDLDKELAMIEARNAERNIIISRRRLQDWYLERAHLLDLLEEFENSEEALLPDGSGRTFEDILNTEEEDHYEKDYWTNRLAKQAATDMLFYGRIGTGNMDAILSMDPEQQAETFALTMNFSSQLQQYTLALQSQAEEKLSLTGTVENRELLAPVDPKQQDNDEGDSLDNVYNL